MLRRKQLKKIEKTNLLLGRSYVSPHSCFSAVLTGSLQLRDGRKADLEKHVEVVNSLIREADVALDSSEEEYKGEEKSWDGIEDNRASLVNQQDEYTDDERFTTVTVEAVDVSKDGLQKAVQDEDIEREASGTERSDGESQRTSALHTKIGSEKGKRTWSKELSGSSRKRKKKFRYENKAERKATRYKERSGNKAKARARKE